MGSKVLREPPVPIGGMAPRQGWLLGALRHPSILQPTPGPRPGLRQCLDRMGEMEESSSLV